MDDRLKKIVIGSVLFGVGKITELRLTSGRVFKNPILVPSKQDGFFGIKNPEEADEVFAIKILEVETVY